MLQNLSTSLRKGTFVLACVAMVLGGSSIALAQTTGKRGMWVWTSKDHLANATMTNRVVNGLITSGTTDVFLYLTKDQYTSQEAQLRKFVALCRKFNISVWGLEGYRGYFSDADGPAGLYAAADAMIAYNKKVAANERIVGFHSDMEPQDGQGVGPNAFVNGKKYSAMTATEKASRDKLMLDWVTIHEALSKKLRGAGLKFGAAFTSWMDDYEGEPVTVVHGGSRKNVINVMMPLVDDYLIMSYNVDPNNAANRVIGELKYADTLANPPKVYAAVETHKGVGATISYGDHATKATKAAVIKDIDVLYGTLGQYKSFGGVAIHDWEGWRDLPPVSNKTTAPVAVKPPATPTKSGWRAQ